MQLPEELWLRVRVDVENLLRREGRPLSTLEIVQRNGLEWAAQTNGYELAQILREDNRFADLGRMLFALAEWGLQERELLKDLALEILKEHGTPMRASEILARLQERRSASPTSLSATLRQHPQIVAHGFGYYGLKMWQCRAADFLVTQKELVGRIILRTDPPITFGSLCEALNVETGSRQAANLWHTIKAIREVRTEPDVPEPGTRIWHLCWSLERALYSLLAEAGQPLRLYEIEWELREKFAAAFDNVAIHGIEKVLWDSPFFVRDAEGAYFLEQDLETYGFDVRHIRVVCRDALSEHGEILGCDDLLARLAEDGMQVDRLSPSILAAILRSDNAFMEIGINRFGSRR